MIDIARLEQLVASGEALDVEFKSDRHRISDSDIYEEVVALANASGGVLLIGVEDDGAVTGAKPRHGKTTDPIKLQAAIFNNTVPSINTRISVVHHVGGDVLAIEVDPYPEPCATRGGKSVHRTIGGDGKPQTAPFYPRDQRSRRVDLGLMDFSAQPESETSFDSFDPLEFERLKQTITRLHGDQSLLKLSDQDVAKALRLVESQDGKLVPTVAGLLLLGREEALRDAIPTHDVRFQAIDTQGNVKVNDVFHGPLLRTLEAVESRFAARNEEKEVLVGLFRVPIPDYSPEGFREAVNNAILHRDYSRLDALYIQWQPDGLLITSPGGFPTGITVDNLLVHEPKPRNPRLAEAFKRIGLVEQTGRGVDKIYLGQLRYGRPAPDYSRSDPTGVRVGLRGGKPSLQFAAFVYEQDREGHALSLDELMVLNALFFERRIDTQTAAKLIQKDVSEGRAILERLHERGLIEAAGEKKGRVFHLSAALYRRLGESDGYVRTHGIDRLRQEGLVTEFLQAHGKITRGDVTRLLGITSNQARRILDRMKGAGKIKPQGKPPRWVYYVLSSA